MSFTQVDQDQVRITQVAAQLGCQGAPHIGDRGKGRDDQRQGCGHLPLLASLLPDRLHGHGVLAHGNGDAQFGTELHAHRLHGVVESRILACMAGGGHPVGGEFDIADLLNATGGDIGDRLADGHAAGGRGTDQGQRGALAHGHGLTGVTHQAGRCHRQVGHRHLPGPHHLVPGHHAGNGTVTDGDEKGLVGHRGQLQYAQRRLFEVDATEIEIGFLEGPMVHIPQHAWRLAEQQVHGDVDGIVVEVAVAQHQVLFRGGLAHHGVRTALPLTDGLEVLEPLGVHRHHVALLGLVAPDLHRRHARIIIGHRAQFEAATQCRIVYQFRQGVGESARAHIVDKQDGILLPLGPAGVDHLLAAAFHLRVRALYRGEVEILRRGPAGHTGGGAAAEADEHGGTAQHHQGGAGGEACFFDVLLADVAETTGQHDRLVVATQLVLLGSGHHGLEGTEVAAEIGTAEFVVEGGGTDGPLQHDIEGRDDAVRLAVVHLPGLGVVRQLQIGDRETAQARLGLGALTGGPLVADLATGTGGGAGIGGDGGGMVMGLHLHQDMHVLATEAVSPGLRVEHEALCLVTGDDRRVVLVGGKHILRRGVSGIADHLEQGAVLSLPVDDPVRVEDFVTAVLGVGLGEHHQFHVGGIALQGLKALHQVVDFVIRQGQPQLTVGRHQRGSAPCQHVDLAIGFGLRMAEQTAGVFRITQHTLGHPIMKQRGRLGVLLAGELRSIGQDRVGHAPLQPHQLIQTAMVGNIGCLAGPGREGSRPGHHQDQATLGFSGR